MNQEEHNSQEEFPSLPEQGKNLIKTSVEVVKGVSVAKSFNPFASKKLLKERMDICNTCEFYHYKKNRCIKCGCFLEFKAKFSDAHCPIDKW